MYNNGTNVVGVCFEGGDFLGGIVIVDADLKVIGATDYPILARDKAAGAYGYIRQFEGFDNGLKNNQLKSD